MLCIDLNMLADPRDKLERVLNPEKDLILKLAAASVGHESEKRDKNVALFIQKATTRCGLGLKLNGALSAFD